VGESGCGKTTTGRLVLRATKPTAGEIWFRHQGELRDLTPMSRRQLKPIRRDMQVIFQDPVSALDVSIQAQVLNLLKDLQSRLGLAYLFVSHDVSVVEHISDRVAVMYLGGIVEIASAQRVYAAPKHPYTEALLSAIPKANPDQQSRRIILQGDVPNPANPPAGCTFHPRRRFAQENCKTEKPPLVEVEAGHQAACHFASELQLVGIEH
jgi:oligopeptide/dipeptide ABC transporter ATP-binding protein